ncbi:hypothetical protein GYMLUDRAFT_59743 [Collybiopsis luxurians FD-317 M1]|uniref:Uncharacterized protein n=1 Tax=Collybiopsis luxurians FD-317 M1 TaxID=944289 RepID=A0A0D0CC03_9AGAR|nr:hypothetical protein GYMLUDRAFT_59743 [Collybiopsis luxurians FD-317 M1]
MRFGFASYVALAFVSVACAVPITAIALSRRAVPTKVDFIHDRSDPEYGYNPTVAKHAEQLVKALLTEAEDALGAPSGIAITLFNYGFPLKSFNPGQDFQFSFTGPTACNPRCVGHMENTKVKGVQGTITRPGQLKPIYEAKDLKV